MAFQKKPETKTNKVRHVIVSADFVDQRIDNFLIGQCKGVPKTRVYRILRKGEVRVNSKRVQPSYRLQKGDDVRIPPMVVNEEAKKVPPSQSTSKLLSSRILYEDDQIMIINKPTGMSVHVGSTVRVGVIEALRHMYPKLPHLELAHRLDSDTSGCLILAKKKRVLREIHELLREGKITKIYWALTLGKWKNDELRVTLPLRKDYQDGGKHVVEVRQDGKHALTDFKVVEEFKGSSLMQVKLHTGRTHQIRVHAAHTGHPVAADDRYGDPEFNKLARKLGLRRLFLHARSIDFTLPSNNQHIKVKAPLDDDLEAAILEFRRYSTETR
jgi:23S rRNA pseudouridine955/2504/2580 synthase